VRTVLYIFGLLTDEDVDWMARVGKLRRLADGDVLIREGERTDWLMFLLEGELLVTGKKQGPISTLRVGEVVGEISAVDSAPPSAMVMAQGKGLALFIDRTKLMQKLDSDSGFGCRFYRALAVFLADRLRTAMRVGSDDAAIGNDAISIDELDVGILDNVSAAGERFTRILKTLSSGAAPPFVEILAQHSNVDQCFRIALRAQGKTVKSVASARSAAP
jgi:CRP/FNR family transcriptional regulator, cyclic AMP receptor protein